MLLDIRQKDIVLWQYIALLFDIISGIVIVGTSLIYAVVVFIQAKNGTERPDSHT